MDNENTYWLESFMKPYKEADSLAQKVDVSIENGDKDALAVAFEEVLQKLPSIINELEAAQTPKEKKLKEFMKKSVKGFKELLEGCGYGVTYLDKPTKWNQDIWLLATNAAAAKLKKADKLLSEYTGK